MKQTELLDGSQKLKERKSSPKLKNHRTKRTSQRNLSETLRLKNQHGNSKPKTNNARAQDFRTQTPNNIQQQFQQTKKKNQQIKTKTTDFTNPEIQQTKSSKQNPATKSTQNSRPVHHGTHTHQSIFHAQKRGEEEEEVEEEEEEEEEKRQRRSYPYLGKESEEMWRTATREGFAEKNVGGLERNLETFW